MPKTRVDFWKEKFRMNKQRDEVVIQQLKELGWSVLIIWECETKNHSQLEQHLKKILDNDEFRRADTA
jgi:DNA mismatch endonuclease (patch repair protein)